MSFIYNRIETLKFKSQSYAEMKNKQTNKNLMNNSTQLTEREWFNIYKQEEKSISLCNTIL